MSWEKVRLGDVLDYEQPTNYIVSNDFYDDKFSTPVLTAGKSFLLGYTNEVEGVYSNLPVIIFDDFTTASKFVDFPFKVKSSAMKILKAKEGIADTRFMFYLLQTLNLDSEQHKRYWISKFAPLEILLPPLATQKRIAEILDAADALRRKDQELLKKYDELAQAIFIDMFGDPVKNEKGWRYLTLEQISLVKGQYGSGASAIEYNPQKFRYVRITDITENGKLNNKPVSASENNSDYKLQDGDLLFARTGATVGKTYLYKDQDGPCIYAGYLIRFRINREFAIPDYIFHFCKTKFYKNWVSAKQNVVAQPNINAQQYGKELLIPIPPIDLQERFLKLLTSNEKSSDLSLRGFKKTECLFSALLQKNF